MTEAELLELLEQGRVATLATIRSDGRVDLVPCTYAFEDDVVVTAVDHKPKTTMDLKRLDNVRRFPEVTMLIEHYDDTDWERLWWVRLRGRAAVHTEGAQHRHAIELLCKRYPQYAAEPPVGAAIVIQRTELTGWSATA
ncbi:MAG: TIGR03668 family PPOX class F420-dependent oxidoreductase [Acidimicrobiales bacterium]|uniref:TIGR03668 family PPOX class F420-dependent oxidoreductase n=1 Tax=Candidatus Poriferisodalis multihospitum TaxID=2983191 RepID=UPI001382B4E8|nr:TIGR03668 family PPOX class F420-dependent oxidoreductase [Candidatus Poriferisodalis multihospitum]MCY3584949.1 TIGR03668 family PPOX class F420-dependent oxidoreductase [Acidimicrobiaceae bacterium]MXY02698.1 TIGR03668 family PPOX class F420-dependent oxidoreductase [Acidimicrobiales bacterium]MCY3609249.1 TIGR03668 family PPOX class F420-dependent oxidoreductase [Acidimicrobiaceae bacterium]MDE0497433.1 TIGR03668 family PPOX class F420-dependent oxidoreductase [Acidimicrobiaceae bacterium